MAGAGLAAVPMVPSLGLDVRPKVREGDPRVLEVEGLDVGPQELATVRLVLESMVMVVPRVRD
jgi:hypothetical protein